MFVDRHPSADVAHLMAHVQSWLVAFLLLSMAVTAAAQPVTTLQRPAQPAVAAPDDPEEVLYAAPTTPDRIGRVMAPVFVNGRGPYAFLIDSGASRSAIAPRVVAELGMVPDPAQGLMLRGVTGSEVVPSILIERLQAGDIVLANQQLPVVDTKVFANADGILGVDGFGNMCLHADFAWNRVSIARNGCPRLRRGWIRIPASLRFGQLVRIGAVIRGENVHAIIDTGAARSLGNLALLRVLSLERRAGDPGSDTQVIGATSQEVEGNLLTIPTLYLGKVGIRSMRVTFGDFEVFRLWGLEDEPAIVVGMDMLGTVDGLMIDYARIELRLLPKGALGRAPPTGTRIDKYQ